jgi:hypothetical protein
MIEFQEFPKIPRYKREVIITEKIDGTNAAVVWAPLDATASFDNLLGTHTLRDQHGADLGHYGLFAQSRSRIIVPETRRKGADNHGFAQWVSENADELTKLGPGVHYGEWWGSGIQRRYGLTEKRFSLFNVSRWGKHNPNTPTCCHVVPVLAHGLPNLVDDTLLQLRHGGSAASPGFMNPEGIIIWHTTSKQYYKVMLDNDETPKSKQEAA